MAAPASPPSTWRVAQLAAPHAELLSGWRYPAPYDRYSLAGAELSAPDYLSNGFVALVDADDALVGFRCFGPDGRVPGGTYNDAALDTGGGLRPDLCGQGYGRAALQLGLDYGQQEYEPRAFRVTVWSMNERALRVVRSLGFQQIGRFTASANGDHYTVLSCRWPTGRSL